MNCPICDDVEMKTVGSEEGIDLMDFNYHIFPPFPWRQILTKVPYMMVDWECPICFLKMGIRTLDVNRAKELITDWNGFGGTANV